MVQTIRFDKIISGLVCFLAVLLVGERIWPVEVFASATRTYTDHVWGIAFDIPDEWEAYGSLDAQANLIALDKMGKEQDVLSLVAATRGSSTLDSALNEVKRALEPHIRNIQRVHLGEFEAMRLDLTPDPKVYRPSVIWVMVTPSGRAITITPRCNPVLFEPVLATLRAVPIREPWEGPIPKRAP